MIPTPAHIEGFFHGMAHSQKIAGQTVRGKSTARAIGREQATLTLLREKYEHVQTAAKSDVRYDFASFFLSPYLPTDRGAPAFGETGSGPFEHEQPAEHIARRIRNDALIGLAIIAAIMLVIHFVIKAGG